MPFTEKEMDNIDASVGAPGWCRRTERQELEAAIRKGTEAIAELRNRSNPERHHLRRLVDAARKYLETLPKPLWRVTAWLPEGNDSRRAATYETARREEALAFAGDYLKQGMRWVTVTQVKS